MLCRGILAAWRDLAKEMGRRKEEVNWSATCKALQSKAHTLILRTGAGFYREKEDRLVRIVWNAWFKERSDQKVERERANMKQETVGLKAKFAESIKQRIYMQCYTQ